MEPNNSKVEIYYMCDNMFLKNLVLHSVEINKMLYSPAKPGPIMREHQTSEHLSFRKGNLHLNKKQNSILPH